MASGYLHPHNSDLYAGYRDKLDSFWPSEQAAIKETIFEGADVLDIGCGRAGLLTAFKEIVGDLRYTGIDINPRCIEAASRQNPDARLICDAFPSPTLTNPYDNVYCFALFQHFTDWKSILKEMARLAKRHLVLDVSITVDYPTICDPDCSYSYYLGSGTRVPIVVLNAYDLVNYCFTEHVNAASVTMTLTNPRTDAAMAALPQDKVLRGTAIITKDDSSRLIFGGLAREHATEFAASLDFSRFRTPRARMVIDGRTIRIYPKAEPGNQ